MEKDYPDSRVCTHLGGGKYAPCIACRDDWEKWHDAVRKNNEEVSRRDMGSARERSDAPPN